MVEAGEAYDNILVADLQRVIDFLRFAEAKNATLLAVSSAWSLAAINHEFHSYHLHDLVTQVGVNSSITLRKLRFFSWGIGLIIAAGACLVVPAAVMIFKA